MVSGRRQHVGFRSVLEPQDRGRYRCLRSQRRKVTDDCSRYGVSNRAYCGYALESSSPRQSSFHCAGVGGIVAYSTHRAAVSLVARY